MATLYSRTALACDECRPPGDHDRDGLGDHTEDSDGDGERDHWETSVHAADTDGDGASDRKEREAGTAPNRNGLLSFPEPMVYDLVRGLDSRRGELEINLLSQLRARPGGGVLVYAPEVEWAFANGHAVELELPFAGPDLLAWKVAVQGTLQLTDSGRAGHGWQVLAELDRGGRHGLVAAKWLGALRLSERVTTLGMLGGRVDAGQHVAQVWSGLANLSLFAAISPLVTLGVEGNLQASQNGWQGRLKPQVHVQVNHHFRVQWGLGVHQLEHSRGMEGSLRAVVEL